MVELPVLSTSTALTLQTTPPNKTMASSTNKRPSSSGSDVATTKRQAITTTLPTHVSPVYEFKTRPSSSDAPQSVFTNIPHEVLIMICRHVLVQTQGLKLQRQSRRPPPPSTDKPTTTVTATPSGTSAIDAPRSNKKRHPLLAVLLTSRAMYFAGSEVYYGSNILRFSHPEHLRSCVPYLSIDARISVRHIQLTVMWIMTRRVPRSWRPWCDTACYSSLRGCAKAFPKLRCLEFVSVGQSGSETSAWSEAEKRTFEKVVREKVKDFRFLLFTWRTNG